MGGGSAGIIKHMKALAREIIFVVEEDPAGGFTSSALGHGITTQGDTLDELRAMVRDAVNCYFDADDPARPTVIALRLVKEETFAA